MLHRILLVKLNAESREGLNYVRLKQTAETALLGAYGVQGVRVERAADPLTEAEWDLCITIDYISGVDEQRSSVDPVRMAFEKKFLTERADRTWSGTFTKE